MFILPLPTNTADKSNKNQTQVMLKRQENLYHTMNVSKQLPYCYQILTSRNNYSKLYILSSMNNNLRILCNKKVSISKTAIEISIFDLKASFLDQKQPTQNEPAPNTSTIASCPWTQTKCRNINKTVTVKRRKINL